MKYLTKVSRLALYVTSIYCANALAFDNEWQNLLDDDLSQWDTYLSYKMPNGYKGELPTDKNGKALTAVGINKDPNQVFSFVDDNGQKVLRVSGEFYGCLFTKTEYRNYHLTLKMKWGDKKWQPRQSMLKDSGILYHSQGPMAAEYWRSWMLSQEFQIMEGHMGDYWSQANSAIDVKAIPPEGVINAVAAVNWPYLPFGEGSPFGGYVMRSNDFEREHGEWNTLELITLNGKSLHIVNGEVVMVLSNSRYIQDGKSIPLEQGKIQLQSEAAELFFKDIKIKPITALAEKYQQLF